MRLRSLLECIGLFLILGWFVVPKAWGETESKIYVYNSAHDILYGRAEETIIFKNLRESFRHYPGNFKLIGVGLGNNPERLGNYFVTGTVRNPLQYWVDSAPPYRMEEVSEIHSSFFVLALANPGAVFKRVIENAPDFLTLLADQLEKFRHVKLAAIQVKGKFTAVKAGVTEKIVYPAGKRPVRAEAIFEQQAEDSWEMAGIYAREQNLQLQVSFPGYPVHLHGFQQREKRGGHIISASVVKADVYIYPIKEFDLYQTDLTLTVERYEGKIRARLRNLGIMEVGQVGIEVELSGTSINFLKTIPLMKPGQRIDVEFEETETSKFHPIQVRVDPENQIWEVREDNNMVKFPAVVKELFSFE
jgi:hypothetical protein